MNYTFSNILTCPPFSQLIFAPPQLPPTSRQLEAFIHPCDGAKVAVFVALEHSIELAGESANEELRVDISAEVWDLETTK